MLGIGLIVIGVEASRVFAGSGEAGPRPGRKDLIHRGVIGGLLSLFLLGAVLVRPSFLGRELVRVLVPWRDLGHAAPPAEPVQQERDDEQNVLKIEPGNTEIQRGDSLRIVADPGRPTAVATLRYRGTDGVWLRRPMPQDPERPERFSEFLRDVGDDLSYQVEAGPVASPVYQVRVYDAAALKAIRLSYRYPSSAGLIDQIVTNSDGAIEAIEGTRVEVTLVATGPLRSSLLRVDGGPTLPMSIQGAEASGTVEVTGDGEYFMTALDTKGTPVELPGRYSIHAIRAAAKAE
jgi:hypothetical protein